MRIVGYEYVPNRFTVTQGVPVEWRIDASEAAGCGVFCSRPSLAYASCYQATVQRLLRSRRRKPEISVSTAAWA